MNFRRVAEGPKESLNRRRSVAGATRVSKSERELGAFSNAPAKLVVSAWIEANKSRRAPPDDRMGG
jgi:hypothetical protein